MQRHIVVIGGGMAGTAASYSLAKQGYDVTIVERDDRLGGRMRSETLGDMTVEMGAGFLTGAYTNTLAFLRETGLSDKLQERKNTVSISKDGNPLSLSDPGTLLGKRLLSLGAKVRLAGEIARTLPHWESLDLHDLWRADRFDDQSIAGHFDGRYGRELVDYVFGPAIDSYFYWSPERTSYALAKVVLKNNAAVRQQKVFMLKGGLTQIPEMAAHGSRVLLAHEVTNVDRTNDNQYNVAVSGLDGKRVLQADGVVCATTADVVSRIIKRLSVAQRAYFSAVRYSSGVTATYRSERKGPGITNSVAYPAKEDLPIAAMVKLADISSHADAISLYASGRVAEELATKKDAVIESILSSALELDLSSAQASHEWRVQRWPMALPEFEPGALKRLRSFAEGHIEDSNQNLVFAGDYIGGPFIEGAFTSGIRAAERLDQRLKRTSGN